jgi:hypothetical protein
MVNGASPSAGGDIFIAPGIGASSGNIVLGTSTSSGGPVYMGPLASAGDGTLGTLAPNSNRKAGILTINPQRFALVSFLDPYPVGGTLSVTMSPFAVSDDAPISVPWVTNLAIYGSSNLGFAIGNADLESRTVHYSCSYVMN